MRKERMEMSKSVKIPAGPDPWVCRINEKTY